MKMVQAFNSVPRHQMLTDEVMALLHARQALIPFLALANDMAQSALLLAHYLHTWYMRGWSLVMLDVVLFFQIYCAVESAVKRLREHRQYWNPGPRENGPLHLRTD